MNNSNEPDSSHAGTRKDDSSRPSIRLNDPRVVELIDAACDRFEAEWRAGAKPRLEAFLSSVADHLHPALFAAMLPVEIELRRTAGELPDATGYRQRFPTFDAAITAAFQQRDGVSRTTTGPSSQAASERVTHPTQTASPNTPASHARNNTSTQPTSQPSTSKSSRSAGTSAGTIVWPAGRPCENVAEFQQALTAASIVSAERLAEFVSANQASLQTDDIARWAKRLIKAGLLTEYQAQRVYAGRGASLMLGNYVLLDKLGQGGMGMVMRARQTKMGRSVALKMLSSDVMQQPGAVRRFQQEAHAAAKLIHPNIVTAFDADEANGTHFLAMELIDGPDLAEVIKERGPQPPAVAIDYVKQAATGLAFAHDRGVIHRDIKPSNLLLARDGTIKLLDLGLARIVSEVGGPLDPREAASPVTQTGQVMGTVDFMAPEQAVDTRKADARADIYSLGCTLFRLLTGQNVFEADTLMSKLLAHRENPIPSLLEAGPKATADQDRAVLERLNAVFQRMVAKRADDRFQTMNEVIEALDGCTTTPGAATNKSRRGAVTAASASRTNASPPAGATDVVAQMSGDANPITSSGEDDPTVLFDTTHDGTSSGETNGISPRTVSVIGAALMAVAALVAWVAWPLLFKPKDGVPSGSTPAGSVADGASVESSSPGTGSDAPGSSSTNAGSPLLAAWTEREALTWALENRGLVQVQPARGNLIELLETAQIPLEDFHVESLSVSGLRGEIDASVARLRELGSLRELDLTGSEVTDAGAAYLERLPALTSLNMRGCPIGDAGLKSIGRLTRLTFLSVGEPPSSNGPRSPDRLVRTSLTDASLRELHALSKLETLTLASPDITAAGLAGLIEFCPDLVTLNIEQAPLADTDLEPLAKLQHLRTLGLIQSGLTDGAIEPLTRLKRLHNLNVQGSRITADGVRRLQATLPGCRVFGGEYHPKRNLVRAVVQAKGRVTVTVAGGATLQITDATFNDLPAEFVEQQVDLRNIRPLPPDLLQLKEATELILADSGVSPASLRRLPQLFPNLIDLNLANTEVTDAEIAALATMTSLQRLDLTRTNVSAVGQARLKAANPTCEIKWSAP